MKYKNEIEILIGIVEQYRGENFYDKIHTIVAEHPILSRFESYTSFDEVLANLYNELYKIEQDEERERIQKAIDAVNTIYNRYEDEIESAISTNKMDARISYKCNCEIFLPFFNLLKNITFWCQSTQENVYGTNKQCCSH